MGMLASETADSRRHLSGCILKALRHPQHLSGTVVEDRGQRSAKALVSFLPEIEWQHTVSATKNQFRGNLRPIAPRQVRQGMARNRQFVGTHGLQHFEADQALSKKDGVTAVHGHRIERLK